MPQLVAMIQTTWTHIRVGLYKRDDGHFQFIEEGMQQDDNGRLCWYPYHESELYGDRQAAKADMIQYYAYQVEDEFWVEPDTVVVLEAPDSIKDNYPVLRTGLPEY